MLTQADVSPELQRMAESCPEALNDEELMLVLRNLPQSVGRDRLFGELFRRYQPRVTSWCYRITRNQTSAVDLAQEIFFKAHRHLGAFRGDARLSTWLYAITRNHCLSSIRRMASDPVEVGESVPPGLRDLTAADPDRDIEREQLSRRMWQMLKLALDPLEARVMTLHYGYELPLAVITQRLALTNPSGAKAYIVNARRKLSAVIRRRALTSELKQNLQPAVLVTKEPRAIKRLLHRPDAAALHQSAA
jgi:RNA polymerase sigma-70 factor (ECF subfamily)